MVSVPWRIELFGGLRLWQDAREISRFRTRKTASLLAYLAYFPTRIASREELVDLFWSEAEPEAGRVSLRTALASLRRQLEPPTVPAGSVFVVSNTTIRLNPEAFTSDVQEFERRIHTADAGKNAMQELGEAVTLYRGELLAGHYDEWIFPERLRLSDTCYTALRRLVTMSEQAGQIDRAIDYALQALRIDTLREEAHCNLMRLYKEAGEEAAAHRQYATLEQILHRELNAKPSYQARSVLALPPSNRHVSPRSQETVFERTVLDSSVAPLPLRHAAPPLPRAVTRFFGREEEIVQVLQWLAELPVNGQTEACPFLLTMTGPGGAGKTRLALEIARRSQAHFEEAVYFVALADLDDASLLPDKLLTALGLRRNGLEEPLAQALAILRSRPALIVLDNAEHLLEGVIDLMQTLSTVPGLTCLITSRQRIDIDGEREFPVHPLPTPSHSHPPNVLTQFPSVQLFLDRAQMVRPDFQITLRNAEAIGKLCTQLEGLPLALELAASWSAVLTPTQMLEQMHKRFTFLVSRTRRRPERHQTLYTAIESSYRLLPPNLQQLFARLSVFRGGWTWEAVQEIGAGNNALSELAVLREHSLVVTTEHGSAMRFGMLETLREFAQMLLTPTEQTELSRLHAHYFCRLAERAEPYLTTGEQVLWLDRLETEQDNLRTALAWCRQEPGEEPTLFVLVCAMSKFWSLRGYFQEGRRHLAEALACPTATVPPHLYARVLLESGLLAQFQGDITTAESQMRQSLTHYEAIGDERGIAQVYTRLGTLTSLQGKQEEATAYQEAVLQFWRRLDAPRETASSLNNLGNIANIQRDYASAHRYFEEGITLARSLNEPYLISVMVGNLGLTYLYQGRLSEAKSHFEESLALRQQIENRPGIAGSKANLAMVAFELGKVQEAIRLNDEALRIQSEIVERNGIAYSLEAAMLFCVAQQQYLQAAQLGGAAEALREQIHAPLSLHFFRSHFGRSVTSLRANLSPELLQRAWLEGRNLTFAQAVTLVLGAT